MANNHCLDRYRGELSPYLRAPTFQLPDLIVLDPPSFSNSKRMRATFDIQRDQPGLARKVMHLLAPQGELIFSTNLRGFNLEPGLQEQVHIKGITRPGPCRWLPTPNADRANNKVIF